jgi:hypothetical protein
MIDRAGKGGSYFLFFQEQMNLNIEGALMGCTRMTSKLDVASVPEPFLSEGKRLDRGFDSQTSGDSDSLDTRNSGDGAHSDESSHKMRRVDWRWAAAKGFLNKDTNQWNEDKGGKEAYIRQRNERISARYARIQI